MPKTKFYSSTAELLASVRDKVKLGWLILTRDVNEEIIVRVPPADQTTEIRVRVMAMRQNGARIGFHAPREVSIHREEVQHRIDSEQGGNEGYAATDV